MGVILKIIKANSIGEMRILSNIAATNKK